MSTTMRVRVAGRVCSFAAILLVPVGCNEGTGVTAVENVVQTGQAVVSSSSIPCAAWNYAIVAGAGDVILNSASTVDSYQSSIGSYGGENVGSNAIVVSSAEVKNNGGVLNGQETENSATDFSAVPVPSTATILPLGETTPGALNINGTSDSITLAPGDYVASNVNVNYPGSITISPAGQVRIWVTGSLNLGGNENVDGVPHNLAFILPNSGWVNVNSNGTLHGMIYAPTSGVNVNSTILGTVIGSAVTLNSGGSVHFDASSTGREVSCSGHGTCAADPAAVLCDCDSGWSGEDCSISAPPIPPRPLPTPPSEVGCYWYTLNGWEAIPCVPVSEVIARAGVPVIPPGLASPYVEATPNPANSRASVLVPPTGSTPLPFVFAQAEMMFPVIGGVQDVVPNPPVDFDGCATAGAPVANKLSVQLNTNKFLMANGDNGAVQFALQSLGLNDPDVYMCAWQVDATTQEYDHTSLCVQAPPPTRDTALQPFDFVNMAGSVDVSAGTLSIVTQLSWVEPGWPNIYAATSADLYGLGGNWLHFDAAVLGLGACTEAYFTDTSVVTRLMGSTCSGVTSATSSTFGCPSETLEPNAKFENRTATAETNNLIQLGTPSVSYPNPYLAVTNVTATTSGSCIDPKHVYVRDYVSDSGAVPSNAAGQAFWESPDIFLVPKDSPVDPDSTPSQALITASGEFDIWVRVHNDLGCNPVTGAKARVYIADPSALSVTWNPLSNDEYVATNDVDLAATITSVTVPAGGKSLIGPFHYTAPESGFGDGHKCLIAAITADGEPPVNDYFDAPNSNQVAQRNVAFESCAYPLTNATGVDGEVEMVLTVVPPDETPSLSTTPNITVTFDDADGAWYGIFSAQAENGTGYSVSWNGSETTVRLGAASVTLPAVPLADGESRTARSVLILNSGQSLTTLAVQATLRNPLTGEQLGATNGGSCQAVGVVVPTVY